MTGFTFQSLKPQDSLSNELRSVIRDNVLQFYAKGLSTEAEEEGLTALYERLSQEDKLDGESNSIANQKKILERYCKDHGITAYRHYDEDDGYSGTNFNRPGFQRMLADIKAGRIKRVIVKDMSRFGRDYLQVGMYTDVVFPEFGVHFIAVNDGVDSTRGESEFTAIRNVFNEMYARDTSKKIRATWQSKGKSGEHLTTIPPYGYMKSPEDKKKWIVDELEASILLYYTGASRSSAEIIDEQKKNTSQGNNRAVEAMHRIKQNAANLESNRLLPCERSADQQQADS